MPVYLIDLVEALVDWAACVGVMLLANKLSRGKLAVMSIVAVFLALFHLLGIYRLLTLPMGFNGHVAPLFVIYYGGLIAIAAVLCYVYEQASLKGQRARQKQLAALELPTIYKQALEQARIYDVPQSELLESTIFDALLPGLKDCVQAGHLDYDLVLLEAELLKIKPSPKAYIAALKLGMAIEKACGYVNCQARNYSFAELMLDLSLRLNSCRGEIEESELPCDWSELASNFRLYSGLTLAEREQKLAFLAEFLQSKLDLNQDLVKVAVLA
jgi:hypothetical protein